MSTGLETESLFLSRLFAEPYTFAIPPYQRSYSWTTKEVGQLLEDVTAAAGIEDEGLASPDYFFGTILLLDPNVPGCGGLSLDVVDGQQRLLTISLLARVLEGIVTDDALAGRLRAMLVDYRGEPRIEVFEEDRPAYEARVIALPGMEAAWADVDEDVSALDTALEYLRQEVTTLSPADQQTLAKYLIDRCHVVVIKTRDIDRAHFMFTVLNDRGRPLQRKDILKVEVLQNIPTEREAEALLRWDTAASKLGNDFEGLFSHIRSIHTDRRPQIISAMRALVRQQGCLSFLENVLTPMADAFYLIRRFPEAGRRAEEHPELAKALISLNRFGNADWVPAAMLAMSRFEQDPVGASRLICEIERLTFLLKVLAVGGTRRNKRTTQMIQALRRGNSLEIDQAFAISREEQRAVGHHLRDIHHRNPALAKLILMRIEDEMAGAPLLLSTSELSVEHILPQRPPSASRWRAVFGEQRETCLHSLGNLALIPPGLNDRLRNKDFDVKLKMLGSADVESLPPLRVNEDVISATEWTPERVLEREARLYAVLARLWRIDSIMRKGDNGDGSKSRTPNVA